MTLEQIVAAVAKGGSFLGTVAWWDLYDSEIAAPDFLRKWTDAGLDPKYLPEVPPPARALRDAGTETLKGHGNKKGDYLLRPAGEQGGVWYYALVREDQKALGTVQHGQQATFAVFPNGHLQVTVHDPSAQKTATAVEAAYHRIHGTYQSRDIREAVLTVLKDSAGVPLRSHGGIYWIPAPFYDTVQKVAKVIGQTGQSAMSILPIHDTPEGKTALHAASKVSLEAALTDLGAELDGWALDVAHGDCPRPSTVEKRIADFASLRERAELYRDILQVSIGDLEAKIAAGEAKAAQVLQGIDRIKSAP